MSGIPNGLGVIDGGTATVGKVESDVTPDPAAQATRKAADLARAAENVRRAREEDQAKETRTTEDVIRSFREMAARNAGMTVEQILALPPEPEPEWTPPPIKRESVLGRGVPELHVRHVFDREPIECEALTVVSEFMASDSTLLVLSGGVGTRKSGSACWALTKHPGLYVTAADLSGLAAARDEEGMVTYRLTKKSPLLVIDDIGGEYVDDKGWFVRVLSSIVDTRYAACLKTIMTTNLAADKFKATYGERTADRIREAGRFRDVAGKSSRVQ